MCVCVKLQMLGTRQTVMSRQDKYHVGVTSVSVFYNEWMQQFGQGWYKAQLSYTNIIEHTGGVRGERRGVPILWLFFDDFMYKNSMKCKERIVWQISVLLSC
jgi:hypothetical protein